MSFLVCSIHHAECPMLFDSSLCLHFASVKIACGLNFPSDWFDNPFCRNPSG